MVTWQQDVNSSLRSSDLCRVFFFYDPSESAQQSADSSARFAELTYQRNEGVRKSEVFWVPSTRTYTREGVRNYPGAARQGLRVEVFKDST